MLSNFQLSFPLVRNDTHKNSKFKKPWFTQGLLASSRTRSHMYNKFKKGKITKEEYTKYRNLYTNTLRTAKFQYYSWFFNKHKFNIKAIWQYINIMKNSKSANVSISSSRDLSDLNDFFADLGPNSTVNVDSSNTDFTKYLPYCKQSFYLTETNPEEVISTCSSLLSKNSCGHDSISTKLLKSVISTISQPLSHVFNLSFRSGTFPDRLKIAKVVPIFKGGDSTQYINFRPISLLPSLSKILEKLMYCRLEAYMEKFNLLNSNQFGFRTGT